jgi:uncharacterized protein YdaU (DUF1376 family)
MKEMEKVQEKQAKAKQSAQQRWMRTHSERNANGMLTNNHNPITNNQKPIGIAKVSTAAVLSVVGRRVE